MHEATILMLPILHFDPIDISIHRIIDNIVIFNFLKVGEKEVHESFYVFERKKKSILQNNLKVQLYSCFLLFVFCSAISVAKRGALDPEI